MGRAAVKNIASSVATIIVRDTIFEGERVDGDGKTATLYDRLRLRDRYAVRPLRCKNVRDTG